MIRLIRSVAIMVTILIAATSQSYAQSAQNKGLRFGLGTDVGGGLAYGAELNILQEKQDHAIEFGIILFGGKFEEDSEEGIHIYHEESKLLVLAVMSNYLMQYAPVKSAYFVFGFGAGIFSGNYRESSLTDTSLGPALSGGGSFSDEDFTVAGTIINIGAGYRFTDKTDLRFQVPTFLILGGPDRAPSTIPTFTLTMGIRI